MQGASPLASRDLNPRGIGSAGVSGACGGAQGDGCLLTLPPCPRRGACPVGRLLTLPSRQPQGGLPSLPPANPAFSLLSFPHPPAPLPSGKGEIFTLFRRGLRPRHPGVKPLAALTVSAVHVPGGGVPSESPTRRKTDRTAFLLAVPAAKERGDRGRWNYPSQATAAFEMVLSPGAGRASAAGGRQSPPPPKEISKILLTR